MAKYIYNGIELPEWDYKAYPYAYIWVFGPFFENRLTAYLHISPSIEYFVPDSGRWCIKLQDSNYLEAKIVSDLSGSFESAQWGAFEAGTGNARVISEIRWANFDVLNADGSVYLEASEPVLDQVYVDRLKRAFWQGFAAGCGTIHHSQEQPEIIATLEDGVLYIQKAPATLNEGTLEVCNNV